MRTPHLLLAAMITLTLVASDGADARRMGGGRSFGAQRESVTPSRPAAAPSTPANSTGSTTAPAAAPAKAPSPAAAPAAPTGMGRWLGPIAGIAAGLGLAALMSHMGLSEGFGSLLLILLALIVGVYLLRSIFGRRAVAATPAPANPASPAASYDYAPSAQPAWRPTPSPVLPAETNASSFGVTRKPLPRDFDAASFAREAKRQYIEVQRLYDNADRNALAGVMTAEMAREVGRELDDRGAHQATEIVSLDAEVLEAATELDKHWVSVRFTGQVREDGEPVAKSIDEVWNLTKPVNGRTGWLLAGISQLA
jgi:predicted lipid-binding transport protein (Tim44 family)